ncbi:hypothetical protein TELCIR_21321, partial [Teladorsagia circumcincta]
SRIKTVLGESFYDMKVFLFLILYLEQDSNDVLLQNGFSGTEAYFRQKLDHFDNKSDATWLQRYFYNQRYHQPGGNAVFLMLGGAGVLDIMWVYREEIPFVHWAKERGALIFALEHRFYGKSRPT